jgi:ABC-type Zn uptake system ZnuABC Zn-binding protein ZnuA
VVTPTARTVATAHDDGGHSHDDEAEGHSHGHGDDEGPGPNPHVWTGLLLAADLVDGIADALGDLDPEGAQEYRERAGDARTEIEALHDRVAQATATIPEGNRTLIVYHDAWSYFARDYGLEMVTAVQPSDYAEPSAGDVREIIDLVEAHDVPALFGSEVFPSDVLDTIAEETGATYVGDLADDTLPGEPGDPEHTYLELMRRNAELIVEHLGGDVGVLRG